MAPLPPGAPLGIYLHVPFCAHICPYCDFNTFSGQEALIPRYVDALEREIARQGAALNGRAATTVFFGGGTPSLLSSADVARLVRAVRDGFDLHSNAEISLEANPTSVDEAYFAGLLEAGVNRLSLGIQTQQRRGLRVLGRNHEASEAAAAYTAARAAGYANVSLDLIFGWPGQTPDAWADDLETVLGWAPGPPEHLSCYNLIVEPGTPLAEGVARGILRVPDDDAAADLYEAAIDHLTAAGYVHYEVANWARDESLASRHNQVYWRNGDYVGAGAGAHGTIAGQRVMQHLLPKTWIEAVERGEPPISNVEAIGPATAMGETMMLGLRLLGEGVEDEAFRVRHGQGLKDVFPQEIEELVGWGLLDRRSERVRLSRRGLMLANDVCARFLR